MRAGWEMSLFAILTTGTAHPGLSIKAGPARIAKDGCGCRKMATAAKGDHMKIRLHLVMRVCFGRYVAQKAGLRMEA